MNPVRVLVAYRHPVLRAGMRVALSLEPGIAVVATAATTAEAADAISSGGIGVAVVDAELPPSGGIEAARTLKALDAGAKVIVVTPDPDPAALHAAALAGVDGYLHRGADVDALAAAVRQVHRGEVSVPGELLGGLIHRLLRRQSEDDAVVERFARLSARERQVAALVAEGRDHREIGTALQLSPHTARTHIQNVLEKLGVHSRVEAVSLLLRHDLLRRFPVERTHA